MSRTIENPYENFIALSRYARWISEENRRETWGETVDRYFDFMLSHLEKNHNYKPSDEEKSIIVKKLNVSVNVYFTAIIYDKEVYSEEGNELLQSFKNKEKVVVVGIAKPNYFIEKVKNDKDHIKVYPDHHNFTDAEIAELNNWSKTHPIITTEKDYVRLKGKIKQNLYYLPIKIKFLENEFSFTNKIKKYVESSARNSSLFKK